MHRARYGCYIYIYQCIHVCVCVCVRARVCIGGFFSCLTGKRRPNARPDALPALRRTSLVGEVKRLMTLARHTIAVVITFSKSNKNSLERRTGAYRSSEENIPYNSFCGITAPIGLMPSHSNPRSHMS
jgi:hypothetical protein